MLLSFLVFSGCGSNDEEVFTEIQMMFEHDEKVDTYTALKDPRDHYISLSDLRSVLSNSTDSFELKPERLAIKVLRNEPYNGKPITDAELYKYQPIAVEEKLRSEKKDASGSIHPYRNSKRFLADGEEFILAALNVGDRVYFPLTELSKLLPDVQMSLSSNAEDVLRLVTAPRFRKEVHNDRDYEWYIDQADTGACAQNNCGPSVAVMVEKWYHPSESTAEAAREAYPENQDWWSVSTIVSYLQSKGVPVSEDLYFGINDLRKHVDAGAVVICCLDTSYLPYMPSNKDGIGRFYDYAGGHFLIIKGYVEAGDRLLWETYDPNNWNMTNADGSPMGKNRLYATDDLQEAIEKWWRGILVVFPEKSSKTP